MLEIVLFAQREPERIIDFGYLLFRALQSLYRNYRKFKENMIKAVGS
jgi:hypothetical protein